MASLGGREVAAEVLDLLKVALLARLEILWIYGLGVLTIIDSLQWSKAAWVWLPLVFLTVQYWEKEKPWYQDF